MLNDPLLPVSVWIRICWGSCGMDKPFKWYLALHVHTGVMWGLSWWWDSQMVSHEKYSVADGQWRIWHGPLEKRILKSGRERIIPSSEKKELVNRQCNNLIVKCLFAPSHMNCCPQPHHRACPADLTAVLGGRRGCPLPFSGLFPHLESAWNSECTQAAGMQQWFFSLGAKHL